MLHYISQVRENPASGCNAKIKSTFRDTRYTSDDEFYRRRIFIDAPDGIALRGKSVVWRTSRSRHLRVAGRVVSKQLRHAPRFADPFASKNHVALVAIVHPEKDRHKPDISNKSSPLETYERISGRIISLSPSRSRKASWRREEIAGQGIGWTFIATLKNSECMPRALCCPMESRRVCRIPDKWPFTKEDR
ncbi:PREDICTED: uncharacterized protein LOC105448322 [Wasmannia auropunctata]|uniref:uncharacterized protein LOC105448322 n=1 Tax=Wasmannia auropunctata TaxID=64793 RepID=UPI0005F09B09|nr:PREDICTED: uncharacterized protein LOC105448322 [Wasmannia auropunctata]